MNKYEEYLTPEELDLYNHLTKKRAIKEKILKKRKELDKLNKEYRKNTDEIFWSKYWLTKQAVNRRACTLDNKIMRLDKMLPYELQEIKQKSS